MAKYHGYGEIIKEYKTKPDKSMCAGCYCDIYNSGAGGAKQCWSFSRARVVDKMAHRSIYSTKPTKITRTLSCYHGVNK